MIGTHCGQKLKNLYGQAVYTEDCATKKRGPLHHVFICGVCHMTFTQRVRVPRVNMKKVRQTLKTIRNKS